MEKLCISGRSLECTLAIFDMTGTLIATEPRIHARAEAGARILGRLAGEEAVENWARLSGVNLETGISMRMDPWLGLQGGRI